MSFKTLLTVLEKQGGVCVVLLKKKIQIHLLPGLYVLCTLFTSSFSFISFFIVFFLLPFSPLISPSLFIYFLKDIIHVIKFPLLWYTVYWFLVYL